MKHHIIVISVLLFSAFSASKMLSQSLENKSHVLYFDLKYFQNKDGHNYGLVFNGPELDLGYKYHSYHQNNLLEYHASLGAGGAWSRGMASIHVFFDPFHVFYGFRISDDTKFPIYIGPYVSATYQYHLYPETHGGITSWFTLYDIGVKLKAEFPLNKNKLTVGFSNAIFGLASRPEEERDPYNYSLKFTDFLTNTHSNFQAGSYQLLNHTQVGMDYHFGKKRSCTFGYAFVYLGYYSNPSFEYISHALTFSMNLQKSK